MIGRCQRQVSVSKAFGAFLLKEQALTEIATAEAVEIPMKQ